MLFICNSESFGLGPPCPIDTRLKCQFHFPVPRTLWTLPYILQSLCAVLGTGVQVGDLKFISSSFRCGNSQAVALLLLQKEFAEP